MKTLQIKDHNSAPNGYVETVLWNNKSARDVLREQYHDNCVLGDEFGTVNKPVQQPQTNNPQVSRPTTYAVFDRSNTDGREDSGTAVGVLVELP